MTQPGAFVGSEQWITLFADASFCPDKKAVWSVHWR